jgi:hypothetical protein
MQAAQHPAQVWNTVARPSPVYISDRIDVEKGIAMFFMVVEINAG